MPVAARLAQAWCQRPSCLLHQPTNNASASKHLLRGRACMHLVLLLLQINLQYGFAKRLYDGRGGW
jgi:hypothetical protein